MDRSVVVYDGEILADDSPVNIFNQDDILERANLKKTSLFDLAQQLKADPIALTQYYIKQQGGQHG